MPPIAQLAAAAAATRSYPAVPGLPDIAITSEIVAAIRAGAWIVFNLSGGKDSSAALFAVNLQLDSLGHPRARRMAIHADLGRAEWDSTPDTVARIAASADVPLTVVRRAAGDLVEARRIQKAYYYQHGTTLAGLMLDHGVDPHHFLDYVHDIDMGRIRPCPVTATSGTPPTCCAPSGPICQRRSPFSVTSTAPPGRTPMDHGPFNPVATVSNLTGPVAVSSARACWPAPMDRSSPAQAARRWRRLNAFMKVSRSNSPQS